MESELLIKPEQINDLADVIAEWQGRRAMRRGGQVEEGNSDGWQKGFTNVTPGAPHDLAACKRQICFLAASAMPRVRAPAPCGKAAATNITFQEKGGSMARSTGEALAEPF